MGKNKRYYQVDYSRYSFKAEDDWGDYDNGKYREPWFDYGGYNRKMYWCTDGKRHSMAEHVAKWEYFNGEIPDGMQIDHIIPVLNGGTNKLSNLRLVTPKGNANNELSLINKSNAAIKRFEDEEERKKQSERLKKRWNEDERQKYSEMFTGEKNPNFGKKWSEEQRLRASIFSKTDKRTIEHTYELNMAKRKPLIQIFPNGEKKEWESTRQVGRSGEYCQPNVAAACRGVNNHYYKKSYWYYL